MGVQVEPKALAAAEPAVLFVPVDDYWVQENE
jgi:hypothetical protein